MDEMTEKEILGSKIRTLRVNVGLTQEEFGAAIDVCPATVVKWEAGKHAPYKKHIEKMNKLFDTNVDGIIPIVKWNGATNDNNK